MDIFVYDGNAYIAFTHERIEAIKRAIKALNEEQQEYKGVGTYPTKRDLEIESAVGFLETMIDEAESEERWQNARFFEDKPKGWAGVANA